MICAIHGIGLSKTKYLAVFAVNSIENYGYIIVRRKNYKK